MAATNTPTALAANTSNSTTALLSARGAFYQVSLAQDAASASKSFYDVYGLTINQDQTSPQSPILINGITTRDSDIVSRMTCLNNYKVYYSFGQNFGNIMISGEVLLGPLGNLQTAGINRLRDWFWKYRVSVYHAPIFAHVVSKAYWFYLEGMQIMDVDRNFHILPFTLFGTYIDISKNPPNLVNPTTVVLSDVSLDSGDLLAALSVTPTPIANPSTPSMPAPTAASTAAGNKSTSSISSTADAQVPAVSAIAGSNPSPGLSTAPPPASSSLPASNTITGPATAGGTSVSNALSKPAAIGIRTTPQ